MPDQPFLARLDPTERDALEAAGRRRQFGVGQMLFYEGDDGRDVFILIEGLVKVVLTATSGRQVILGLESAGSVLGELSAIDGQPRSASAEAVTPVDVLVLRVEEFRRFLEQHPLPKCWPWSPPVSGPPLSASWSSVPAMPWPDCAAACW